MFCSNSSESSESSDEEVVSESPYEGPNLLLPLLACILHEDAVSAPRRPRKIPFMTGIQWVEEKMKDPREFYNMFRMRRSVFLMLHDTLVSNYQLQSTPYMCS